MDAPLNPTTNIILSGCLTSDDGLQYLLQHLSRFTAQKLLLTVQLFLCSRFSSRLWTASAEFDAGVYELSHRIGNCNCCQ